VSRQAFHALPVRRSTQGGVARALLLASDDLRNLLAARSSIGIDLRLIFLKTGSSCICPRRAKQRGDCCAGYGPQCTNDSCSWFCSNSKKRRVSCGRAPRHRAREARRRDATRCGAAALALRHDAHRARPSAGAPNFRDDTRPALGRWVLPSVITVPVSGTGALISVWSVLAGAKCDE
jgi:hypothetical protein